MYRVCVCVCVCVCVHTHWRVYVPPILAWHWLQYDLVDPPNDKWSLFLHLLNLAVTVWYHTCSDKEGRLIKYLCIGFALFAALGNPGPWPTE
jgi:hypothetical protein